MNKKDRILVLKIFPYNDTQHIVETLSRSEGKKSFLIYMGTGRKSSRKRALVRPGHFLDITYSHKPKLLPVIQEVQPSYIFSSIFSDIKKLSVVFFLLSVLKQAVYSNETDISLFEWIEKKFIRMEKETYNPDFHLYFLTELAGILGFQPELEQIGTFFDNNLSNPSEEEQSAMAFFLRNGKTQNLQQRRQVLHWLEKYFRLHLGKFSIVEEMQYFKSMLHEDGNN